MKYILLFMILFGLQVINGELHSHHRQKRHVIKKRSPLRVFRAPVSTLVDDVNEARALHDKKLKLLSLAGELYPEHDPLTKRKIIPKLTKKPTKDNDDDDDDTDADKKFTIDKTDDNDAEDKNTDNEEDDDDSGSGDEEDASDDTKRDETDQSDDDDEQAGKSSDNKQCRKRCKTPLTFHQCAFPRCTQKLGTIKDLCFFLCKHQKQRCERVCE